MVVVVTPNSFANDGEGDTDALSSAKTPSRVRRLS